MYDDKFSAFISHQKIIAIFRQLYERDPKLPQLPLPILLLQAPNGGGISTLIEFLMERSNFAVPYAHLDFAQSDAPVTVYELLGRLCNQFRHSTNDTVTRKLTFPRCELGISAVLYQENGSNIEEIRKEMERKIAKSLPLYEHLDDLINATANWLFLVAFAFVLFKWLLKFSEKSSILRELIWGPSLKWYKNHSRDLRLPPYSDIADVLVNIWRWSRPGETKQQRLIVEKLLIEAFLEDLREAFDTKRTRNAQERTTNIALFIDSFEVSLTSGVGSTFLDILKKNRFEGKVDPLLIVIGSHQHLVETDNMARDLPFEQQDEECTELEMTSRAQALLAEWKERIGQGKRHLQESSLYLPLPLRDFSLNETASYLLRVVGQGQMQAFDYTVLVEDIYRVTHGHQLALKLAGEVLLDARTRGKNIVACEIMQEMVPLSAQQFLDYEQRTAGACLLSVFLRLLSETEQEQLMYCATPHALDISTLHFILGLNSEKEARELWVRYRKFSFVQSSDNQTMILHPLLRDLLNERLISQSTPGRNYYKVAHHNLREYFAEIAASEEEKPEKCRYARMEEAYHALALGVTEPAIAYISSGIENNDDTWRDSLARIVEAPTISMPQNIRQRAGQALIQAKLQRRVGDAATALVLHEWLLHLPGISPSERAALSYELSEAYRYLPEAQLQEHQKIARAYFEKAHALTTKETALLNNMHVEFSEPIVPFPVRKISKVWRNLRVAAVTLLMITMLCSYAVTYYGHYVSDDCDPDGVGSPVQVVKSLYFSHGMRVTHASDGECIGISDGSFAFNVSTNLASGADKMQAAKYFKNGDMENAAIFWEKAHHEDPADPETLIYEENQNVLNLAKSQRLPYVTIIVFTMLTSSPERQKVVATGRDDLRGAYMAQVEQNSSFKTPLLRILIANAGDSSIYAIPVANQIIQAVKEDKTIVGVLGPAQSRDETVVAVTMLGKEHVPTISATASSDTLTKISPFFFRVSPTNNDQVRAGIDYAERDLGAKTAVLFEDPYDNYSKSLASDFVKRFQDQDHLKIFKIETYNAKDIANMSNIVSEEINSACMYNPDLIYFSGRSDTMLTLLKALPFCGTNDRTKIMAGDELDQIISEPSAKFPTSAENRVYYTSFASPYQWDNATTYQHRPNWFFDDYSSIFQEDASSQHILPNGYVILAYDTTVTFLTAITNTIKRTRSLSFSLEELQESLGGFRGDNVIQGVSGVIDFGPHPDGDPVDKAVVVLRVNKAGTVSLADNVGRLQK